MKKQLYRLSKSTICLVLSLVLTIAFFSLSATVTAFANNSQLKEIDPQKSINAEITQVSDIPSKSGRLLLVSNENAENLLLDGWNDFSNRIDVSNFNLTVETAKLLYGNVFLSNPDYFYVDMYNIGLAVTSSGQVVYIAPNYIYTKEKYNELKIALDNKVDAVLDKITSDMSDFDKALTVHDYLALSSEYDLDYYKGVTISPESYTAYGALVKNVAVCQGYSLAYMMIMNKLGIDCIPVTSDSMNHMWIMIRIDGSYYHVDVTWDDARVSTPSQNTYDYLGNITHDYFLLNDTEMLANSHYDWNAEYSSTSTAYSSSFVRKANQSAAFYKSGYYYYIDNGKVIKRNKNTAASSELYTIASGKWNLSSTSYLVWPTTRSHLAMYGNTLYLNEVDKIKSISTSGSSATVYTPNLSSNECLTGCGFEDGVLKYDKTDSNYISTLRIPTSVSATPNYAFSVKIMNSDGTPITGNVSASVGDVFGIYVEPQNDDLDDSYTLYAQNPEIVYYDTSTAKIVVKAEGTATITISSVKDPMQKQTITFSVSNGSGSILYGDANNDGKINITDMLYIKKYIVKIYNANNINMTAADVNCDEKINISDMLLIKKYIVGIVKHLGKQ